MNQEKINNYFKKLGLNDKEINVYLFLLSQGPQLVSSIAKGCNITRTHAYDIIKGLEQHGLCNSLGSEYGKKIQAFSGKEIKELIILKEKEIQSMKNGLADIISGLTSLTNTNKLTRPHVSYFNGAENIKKLINLSLHSEEKKIRVAGSEIDLINLLGNEFIIRYHKRRTDKQLKFLALRPGIKRGKHEILKDDIKNLREVRLRPKEEIKLKSNIMIWSNKIAIYSLGHEPFGTLIENEELSLMMKSWFDFIWSKSKKI